MANRLQTVTIRPQSIDSGKDVTATVAYRSSAAGEVLISCSPSFRVSPRRASCPRATSGSVEVKLTITRIAEGGPRHCTLLFDFFSDERRRLVEIT